MRTRMFTRAALAIVFAACMGVVTPSPASALAVGNHKDPTMVDIDTPVFVGYDATLKAYHLYVLGRWRPVCGSSDYCWPSVAPSGDGNIGSNDAVRMRFSD